MKRFILAMLASYGALARESPFNIISREAERSDVTVHRLRGNVHLLEGSGGNICVLANRRAALMVDAGIAVSKEKIHSALDSIGAGTPKYLVNTHWHWDHTDGNQWVHAAGATIIDGCRMGPPLPALAGGLAAYSCGREHEDDEAG